MDRTRFSHIAHRQMAFCSPIGIERVDRAIAHMALSEGAEVVDFGAGKCGWLAMIAAAVPRSRCIGIEPAAVFADEAADRHAGLVHDGRLEIVQCKAAEFLAGRGAILCDAALCIGSTHAFGGYDGALEALSGCVKPGGAIVVAEGYWKKHPDKGYLKALGGDETEFTNHAGNIERAISRGLAVRWASTVTNDEWDEYEWGYSRGIESFVKAHPDDPDAAAMIERSRSWRDAYVKWGRDTLGFGVYVLENGSPKAL